MNNICKYSQKGTRVYLSLQQIGEDAVFIFKNTSSAQLNMSEEELMERFTRGDSSRNTEGNGLGWSIAKSMAKIQNGELKLMIDGDLFKAILSFPSVSFSIHLSWTRELSDVPWKLPNWLLSKKSVPCYFLYL